MRRSSVVNVCCPCRQNHLHVEDRLTNGEAVCACIALMCKKNLHDYFSQFESLFVCGTRQELYHLIVFHCSVSKVFFLCVIFSNVPLLVHVLFMSEKVWDKRTSLHSLLLWASAGTGRHRLSQFGRSSRGSTKTFSFFFRNLRQWSQSGSLNPFSSREKANLITMTVVHQREVSLRCLSTGGARCQFCAVRQISVSYFLLRRVLLDYNANPYPRASNFIDIDATFASITNAPADQKATTFQRVQLTCSLRMLLRQFFASRSTVLLHPRVVPPRRITDDLFSTSDLYPLVGRTWPSCRCNCFDYFGTYVFPCCILWLPSQRDCVRLVMPHESGQLRWG